MRISFERKAIAYVVMSTLSIVLIHAVATLLRKIISPTAPAATNQLVWAGLTVILISAIFSRKWTGGKSAYIGSMIISAVIMTMFILLDPTLMVQMIAVAIVCPLAVVGGFAMARRLPEQLDGTLQRYPVKSVLWMILALLMVVQTARLSSWVSDPTADWWISTKAPFFAQHMCMAAYIYAADLNRQGHSGSFCRLYSLDLLPGRWPDLSEGMLACMRPCLYRCYGFLFRFYRICSMVNFT
jgi:hypothetical protein